MRSDCGLVLEDADKCKIWTIIKVPHSLCLGLSSQPKHLAPHFVHSLLVLDFVCKATSPDLHNKHLLFERAP